MLKQLKHCISKVHCWFSLKIAAHSAAIEDMERAAFSRDEPDDEDQHPWTFEVSWDVVGNVADMVTINGEKNILIGPYRAERAASEILESEFPPKSPMAVAVKCTRQKGLTVVTGKWLVKGQPPAILFDVESAKSKFSDQSVDKFEKEQAIAIPDDDQETKDAVVFGYMVAEFLTEFETKRRSGSNFSNKPTTSPKLPMTPISRDGVQGLGFDELDSADASNSNPSQKSATIGDETCAVFHDWNCGVGLILLHQWQSPIVTVFTLKNSQLQGHFQYEKRVADDAKALGMYHRFCIERGAALASDIFSCFTEKVAERAEIVLDKRPDYVILQN